ncbi:MAG: hypothetical protein WC334_01725 [Kiritimatiellales bacterium]|jgi:hypothetical protein
MKRALFLFLLTGAPAFAGHDWSRYEIIMERSPFGKEPPPEENAAAARPAGEFAKQYRLCMLYEGTAGQLKAGIVSKVNNKNFFLQVGESEEGLSLVEVRLEEGVAVLQQGGETAQLLLEGLGGDPAAVQSQRAVALLMPEPSAAQQIRRTGAESAPGHILAGLTDSAPKQPQITVHKTIPDPVEDSGNGTSGAAEAPPAASAVVAQAPAPANYLVQSVPKRFNPF